MEDQVTKKGDRRNRTRTRVGNSGNKTNNIKNKNCKGKLRRNREYKETTLKDKKIK